MPAVTARVACVAVAELTEFTVPPAAESPYEAFVRFAPWARTLSDDPASAPSGVIDVITGVDATVNRIVPDDTVTPPTVTVTAPEVTSFGIRTVRRVAVANRIVAGVPLMSTRLLAGKELKFCPSIVKVPPDAPDRGVRLKMLIAPRGVTVG